MAPWDKKNRAININVLTTNSSRAADRKGLGWVGRNVIDNDLKTRTLSPKISTSDVNLPRASSAVNIHMLTFGESFCHHFIYYYYFFFFFALHSVRKYWPKLRENYQVRNKTSEIKFIKLRCFSVIIQFGVKHFIVRRDMSKSKSTCRHLTTNQNKVRHELGK